jgi:hypothetical protein
MPTIRRSARITAAAAATAVAAALVPTAPAAAATHCTAWGALPHHVALHRNKTVVKIVLRGSAGCDDQRTDNGATATLQRPSGAGDALRWRHFGAVQGVTMYVNVVRSGTFRLKSGDVQVYNQRYQRVPWTWRPTAMVVKRAAHIAHVSAAGGVVSGRAKHFTMYGWQSYAHKRMFVQRRTVGSSAWHTIGSRLADNRGWVHYRTPTSARDDYRLTLRGTDEIWNARSRAVRG